jgi:uncharacterized membrane protein YfcA
MTLDLSTLLLLALAALVAGAVDAVGGGGGLIALPALLADGLPPALALGTNKGQSVFGSGMALLRYARAGLIDRRRAVPELTAGALGSLAGAALLLLVPPAVLRPLVLALLIAAALVLVFRPSGASARAAARPRGSWIAIAIALVLGAYDGFFGPGTGTFLILAYVWIFGARLQQASADAKVVNFASNVAAVALFAARGAIVWSVALPMAVGQALGGWLGAHLVVREGDRVVRAVALLVIATLVTKIAIDLARQGGLRV